MSTVNDHHEMTRESLAAHRRHFRDGQVARALIRSLADAGGLQAINLTHFIHLTLFCMIAVDARKRAVIAPELRLDAKPRLVAPPAL